MPRDNAGAFTRRHRWTTDRSGGVPLSPERTDEDADDIVQELQTLKTEADDLAERVEVLEEAPAAATAMTMTVVVTAAASPPGSPTEGGKYLVLPTATGTWAGHDNAIATYASSAWTYATPAAGNAAVAQDTRIVRVYDGSGWYTEGPQRRTGTAAFDAASAVAVTLSPAMVNANYLVAIEAPSNHTFWVASKTESGFMLHCSGTISNSVRWSATAQ